MKIIRLTQLEKDFARAYVSTGSVRNALAIAGYDKGTTGKDLLANPNIQAEIDRLSEIKEVNSEVNSDWVLSKLKTIVERSLQAEPVLDKHGNATGEYKNDNSAAIKALQEIGKHIGFYEANNRQKQSLTQNNTTNIDITSLSTEELKQWLSLNEKISGKKLEG